MIKFLLDACGAAEVRDKQIVPKQAKTCQNVHWTTMG